jgi:hypothetical protein
MAHPHVALSRARRIAPLEALIDLRPFTGLPDPTLETNTARMGDPVSGLVHVADMLAVLAHPKAVFTSATRRQVAAQLPDELDGTVVAYSIDTYASLDYGPKDGVLVNLYAADPHAGVIDAPTPQRIPDMPKAAISRLAKRIRSVAVRDGDLWEMAQPDPFTTAFTWDPDWQAPARNLVELVTVRTFHTFGAPSLFKPSKAEVIAQIPVGLIDQVVAFATDDPQLVDGGRFHAATTVLYANAGA